MVPVAPQSSANLTNQRALFGSWLEHAKVTKARYLLTYLVLVHVAGFHGVAGALQKKSSLKGEEKRGRRKEDRSFAYYINLLPKELLVIVNFYVRFRLFGNPMLKIGHKCLKLGPASHTCLTDISTKIVPRRATEYKTSFAFDQSDCSI